MYSKSGNNQNDKQECVQYGKCKGEQLAWKLIGTCEMDQEADSKNRMLYIQMSD